MLLKLDFILERAFLAGANLTLVMPFLEHKLVHPVDNRELELCSTLFEVSIEVTGKDEKGISYYIYIYIHWYVDDMTICHICSHNLQWHWWN